MTNSIHSKKYNTTIINLNPMFNNKDGKLNLLSTKYQDSLVEFQPKATAMGPEPTDNYLQQFLFSISTYITFQYCKVLISLERYKEENNIINS